MEIEIQEEGDARLLSKTQKQKIRRMVASLWTDEAGFYDHIDHILSHIHYDGPTGQRYNHIEHDLRSPRRLVLLFKVVHIETPEEHHAKLLKKLKSAMQQKKRVAARHVDPQEEAYRALCSHLPETQRAIVPRPDQIRQNLETYRQLHTAIPAGNPMRQYLSLFF